MTERSILKSATGLVLLAVASVLAASDPPTTPEAHPALPADRPPVQAAGESGIRPCPENPYYWQYRGEPVMLLGGSKEDNLFQIPDLEEHLDLMAEVGANYIRNTMSSRDEGNVQAFMKARGDRYDLSRWNPEYWDRFERMLRLTEEREIIVQIEVWAFHDFYGEWEEFLPWNPRFNVNYTGRNTQLSTGSYGDYWQTVHDFFLTVPALHNDTAVLRCQQAFVDKILSHTMKYDHVLYCMTNEIFTQYPPEWGWYWAEYIKSRAAEKEKKVYVAEMYQNHDLTHEQHRASLDHPEIYDFIDVSQNSRQLDDTHWQRLQWVRTYINGHPRPINHTKTYGSDDREWTDGDIHGIERFWRNLIGGAASVRFHRPVSGIGLNEKARTQIRSARMLLEKIDIFESKPDASHRHLAGREPDEAYLTFAPQQEYAVYFPLGGKVELLIPGGQAGYEVQWLDIENNRWLRTGAVYIENGRIELEAPVEDRSWVAVLKRTAMEIVESENSLTVQRPGGPLLRYVHSETFPPEGVDPIYRRSAYIHPLWSPGGEVLTRIQPPDHYHHYGIWNPWTRTRIGDREVDFWNLGAGQGRVRFAGYVDRVEGLDTAGFRVRHEHIYYLEDGTEKLAINEMWDVKVHHVDARSFIVDLTTTLNSPLEEGILLEQYRYGGGLGFRATEAWGTDNSKVLTSEGKTRENADGTSARWVIVEGESSVEEGTSGIVFMSHPGNRVHPEPMRMWPPGMYEGKGNLFFEFCPIRHQEWKLEQGRDYILKYRMVVYDGEIDARGAEAQWQRFAESKSRKKINTDANH